MDLRMKQITYIIPSFITDHIPETLFVDYCLESWNG